MSERFTFRNDQSSAEADVITRRVNESNGHKNNNRVTIHGRISEEPVGSDTLQSIRKQINSFIPDKKGRLPRRVSLR